MPRSLRRSHSTPSSRVRPATGTAPKLAWEKALPLLPPDSNEYRTVAARIENINHQLSDKNAWAKRAAKLGPVGVVLWKFKTIALLVLTKAQVRAAGPYQDAARC